MALFRADCMASHQELETYEALRAYAERLEPEEVRPAALLTGKDLIAMGYKPGPRFAEMLRGLEDAQLEGQISDHEAARTYIEEKWGTGAAEA